MIESNSKCKRGSTLQLDTDLYLGGVPRSFSFHSRVDPWLNRAAGIELAGCVHSVEVLEQKEAPEMWRGVRWNCSATLAVGLPPPSPRSCPSNLREGIHFMGDGYAVIPNCQTHCGLHTAIGNIQLSFTVRTTHNAGGLLFLIHGPKKHYLVGYLIPTGLAMSMWFLMYRDGRIPWRVNSCSLKNIRLCDGQWHNITVRKTRSALHLAVDNTPEVSSGYKPVEYLNLTSPIYLGGVKQSPELSAFLTNSVWPSSNAPNVTKGFSGCIKDVKINGATVDLTSATQARNVKLDGCPPEGQGQGQGDKKRGCSSRTPVQTLYRGNNTPLDDLASLPNTDYLYRVLQGNAAGPWVYSRTEMTTSASCPARDPLLQDGYLSCDNTPWENGTKVTHQFRVNSDTFPALCPVSPNKREVRFERAPNRTGPYQRRCTVQDLTKACTGAFKPGTLGCGCIEISGSSFLVEYTFVARPEDSGWWRGSLDCYDADLASPLLSFGSDDTCHDRRVVLPGSSDTSSVGGSGGSGSGSVGLGNDTGSSDTSSDGGSGGSGYGSVGLGNDTDQNTNTTGIGAKADTAIEWFMLYAALGSLGAVTIGTVLGAVGFCWWTRTRSRRPVSSPASGRAYLSRPASRSSLTAPGETLPLEDQAQVGVVSGFEPSFAEIYESTEQTTEGSSWTDDVTQSDVDQGPVVYVVNF